METKKLFLISLLCLEFSLTSFSQNILATRSDFNWRVMPGYPNLNLRLFGMYDAVQADLSLTGDYTKSIIYINGNEAILLTQVNDKKGKVIRFGSDMDIKWESEFEGRGLAIGKLDDKIILIRMNKVKLSNWKEHAAEAVVLNSENGSIANRKPVVGPWKDKMEEWKFYFPKENGNFFTAARVMSLPTRLAIMGEKAYNEKYDNTENFILNEYNSSLELIKQYTISGDFTQSRFLGSEMDANGNLTILSTDENNIVGERFLANSSYTKSDKLFTSIAVRNKALIYPYLMPDNKRPGELLVQLKYANKSKDEQSDIIKFDFNKGKVFTHSFVLDKAFRSDLNTSFDLSCAQDENKFESLDFLKTSKILTTSKGKHIVLSEWVGPERQGSGDMMMKSETATIDFYDENLKHQKRFVIPKNYMNDNTAGVISSIFEKDGKLYFLASHDKKLKTFTMLSVFDLAAMKMVSCNIIDKKDLDKNSLTDPPAALWFKDGFIIPHINYKRKAIVNAEYDYQMQKMAY